MSSFSDTDLLDAMMRAAFEPKEIPQIGVDYNGNPQVHYIPSPALIQPLIEVVKKKLEQDEGFRALLVARVTERIDDIVATIVEKIGASNSAFAIARQDVGGGFGSRPPSYELADWLKEPLGAAMAEALKSPLTEHFVRDGVIVPELSTLNITVEVVPWKKPEES